MAMKRTPFRIVILCGLGEVLAVSISKMYSRSNR
jgi:hypothetical protein